MSHRHTWSYGVFASTAGFMLSVFWLVITFPGISDPAGDEGADAPTWLGPVALALMIGGGAIALSGAFRRRARS